MLVLGGRFDHFHIWKREDSDSYKSKESVCPGSTGS